MGQVTERRKAASWVQTDRATHEKWARLTLDKPRAAALLHLLVHEVDDAQAVVASHETLAEMMGASVSTVKRAIKDLTARSFIEVVEVGKGAVNSYVLNSHVAWTGPRDGLRRARFSATVLAREVEQSEGIDQSRPLEAMPRIRMGERQLPTGQGLPPPSEPALPGMEVDLPATKFDKETDDAAPIGDVVQSLGLMVSDQNG